MTLRVTLWPLNRIWPQRQFSWTIRLGRQTPIGSLWSQLEPSDEGRDITRSWSWRRLRFVTVTHWPPPDTADWFVQSTSWNGPAATVDQHVVLRSTIVGDLTVQGNAALQVDGAVFGNITNQAGADLIVNGYVRGTITNHGHLLIRGVHAGKVIGNGYAVIEPGAQVRRQSERYDND